MENIAVCLRIRPMTNRELQANEQTAWKIVNENKVHQITKPSTYEFNNCFEFDHDNFHIFQTAVRSVILSCLEGINGTIFMYGQTGSGKTFTMLGAKKTELQKKNTVALQQFIKQSFQRKEFNDIGILVYSMMEIFKEINKDESRQFELKCSYYEIYNENVYDLLKNSTDFPESISVVVDHKKEFILKGLIQQNVTSLEEVIEIIHRGEKNRHYAETILNHQSSRSHTIFRLQVNAFLQEDEELKCSTEAIINFIDLAGSEKIANHQQIMEEGRDRIKESQSINKSLFYLTRVIALKTQKVTPAHIPFRNSTLTKLMKQSLNGNCRTLIILCITPTITQQEQSLSTLRFGINAKLIENKIEQNYQYEHQGQKNESLMLVYNKMKEQDQTVIEQQETIEKLSQQVNNLQYQKDTLIQQLKQQCINQDGSNNNNQGAKMIYRSDSVDSENQLSQEDQNYQEKYMQANKQLIAQQEKNTILEKQSQEMFKQIVSLNEQVREYSTDQNELEEIIQELKSQNERLQKFATQALNRLEFYENNKEEMMELEETLKQSLGKVQTEIKIASQMNSVNQSVRESSSEHKSTSSKKLIGVNKSQRQKQLSPTTTPFKKDSKKNQQTITPQSWIDLFFNILECVNKRSQSFEAQSQKEDNSLANRLHNLTEKIQIRKQEQKKKPLQISNKSWQANEIIYETDSEIWIDSCNSIRK